MCASGEATADVGGDVGSERGGGGDRGAGDGGGSSSGGGDVSDLSEDISEGICRGECEAASGGTFARAGLEGGARSVGDSSRDASAMGVGWPREIVSSPVGCPLASCPLCEDRDVVAARAATDAGAGVRVGGGTGTGRMEGVTS